MFYTYNTNIYHINKISTFIKKILRTIYIASSLNTALPTRGRYLTAGPP